jgi:hypothetical protein
MSTNDNTLKGRLEDSFREADREADDLRKQIDRAVNPKAMAALPKTSPTLHKKLAVIRDKRKKERKLFRGQILALASKLDNLARQLDNIAKT